MNSIQEMTMDQIAPNHSASDLERLQEDEAAAKAAGFAVAPPMYALGTPCISLGHENYRASRQQFEQLPLARPVIESLVQRILLEDRRDATVGVNSLVMLDNGQISRGNGGMALSEESLKQLMSRTACPEPGAAATYFTTISPQVRAREVNHWLRATADKKDVVLRNRRTLTSQGGNGRQVYAVVSPKYKAFDVDELARTVEGLVGRLIPGECRADVKYDGISGEICLYWHSNVQPERVCAGEIFKARAGIKSSDDGTQALTPFAGMFRNLCLNFICIDEAQQTFGKRRHMGSDLHRVIYGGLNDAVDSVRFFAEKWDTAKSDQLRDIVRDYPERCTDLQLAAGAFRGIVKQQQLSLPGVKRGETVDELMKSFNQEPEYTRAGLVNAITRTAHEVPLRGAWASEDVEAVAGKVLAAATRSTKVLQYVESGEAF